MTMTIPDTRKYPNGWENLKYWQDSKHYAHDVTDPNDNSKYDPLPEWVKIRRGIPLDEPKESIESIIEKPEHYNLTDVGNAERFYQQWHAVAKYCYERKKWLVWDEDKGVWVWDDGALIAMMARSTVRDILLEAHEEYNNKELRDSLIKHARISESDARLNAMINQAESMTFIKYNLLDKNPYLLNVKNGTIDLRTGELLPHNPKDLITRILPTSYNPAAECPNWLKFLDWMFNGDNELIEYIQRAIGYSMSADVLAQVIFLLYGLGANGKTTLMGVVRKMLGPYAYRIDIDDLLIKDRSGNAAKPGIANLDGKRFVISSEIPQGRKLNVGMIKDLSGEATIQARRLFENGTEFTITSKLWLQGNHMPEINDTTLSIWRRVKLIKCNATIADNQRIDGYQEKYLEPEIEGILAWAVAGAIKYFESGLGHAEAIRTATDSYRHDSDILGDFLEDTCKIEFGATVPKAELKEKYHAWCTDNGLEPISQKTFKARLIERGIKDGVNTAGNKRIWKGIRLLVEGENPDRSDNLTKQTSFPKSSVSRGNFTKDLMANGVQMSESAINTDKTCQKNEEIEELPE